VDNPPHHPRGDFTLDKGFISAGGGPCLTFSGIGAYHPGLFAGLRPGQKYQLATLLRDPIAARRVSGERYGGKWIDAGTPERLAAVELLLRSG